MSELTDRGKTFHTAIACFIEARREAKLKGKDDADAASKYEYGTWIADAAKRAASIQLVTHPLKATFPDAKIKEATNLLVHWDHLPARNEISSHLVGRIILDGTGDAAALGTFKLLTDVIVEDKPLIDWLVANDSDFLSALNPNAETASRIASELKGILRSGQKVASHPMAKQLYWLAGDNPQDDAQYHLLQPMFSSPLAHVVHADIQDARFGEANKETRQARRENKPAEQIYRDYHGLAVRKLGGTKPQNISQLNSERGGVNYLLASLPPSAWAPRRGADLRQLDSVFDPAHGALFWFGEVRESLYAMGDLLGTHPDQNKETRDRVDNCVQAIGQQLALFGAAVRGRYPAGWTRDDACRLPLCEKLWLDPDRTELPPRDDAEHAHDREGDLAFQQAYDQGDWADQVATRFGLWLSGQLRKRNDKLAALGEAEMRHFASHAILDVAWPIPLQRRAKAGAA